MTECIFCRIAGGEIPAEVVADDGEFVAFQDLHPLAPVHVLVVPKQHVSSLNEVESLPLEAAGRMLRFIAAVAAQSGAGESGYRVVANNGADAGQEVQHLHWHIIGGAPLGGMV
jgi:histidine triad (HIT) family protein